MFLASSFWPGVGTGLAIGVGVWLATKLLGGGWDWLTKRKARERQQAAEEYERRAPVRAGFAALASELRWDADIAERCEQGHAHVPSEVANLRVQEWYDRRTEMMPLRDEDPKLWWALEKTYDALRMSKLGGDHPPNSADIRRLIEEVDLRAD